MLQHSPHITPDSPASAARHRGDLIARDSVRVPRARAIPASLRSGAQVALATLAAALMLTPYILPAYADSGTASTTSIGSAEPVHPQSLSVITDVGLPLATVRDGYSVTKPLPPVTRSISLSADTFINSLNSAVQWPFPNGVPISSWFGPRASPCAGCSSFHEGLDMNAGGGAPIQAIADGVVSKIGNPSGSYGVFAVIDHVVDGQKVSSLYGHMLQGSLAMAVGDRVTKGQLVGRVGSTGSSSGAHLHLGILRNGTTPIDPYAWLKQKVGS